VLSNEGKVYSRSCIHLIGKLSLVYSYLPTIYMGRCLECENFTAQIKKGFEEKEMAVNEIKEVESKSVNKRALNIFI